MIKDNYYNILEIPETANPDEIRKAYRKLSLQHHPDRNKNNPDAMAKTQKINEAYETLSDLDKKREYDMMRNNPFFNGNFANGVNGEPNFDDLMSQLFGGMGMGMGGMGMASAMPAFTPQVTTGFGGKPMPVQPPMPLL